MLKTHDYDTYMCPLEGSIKSIRKEPPSGIVNPSKTVFTTRMLTHWKSNLAMLAAALCNKYLANFAAEHSDNGQRGVVCQMQLEL